MKKENKKYPEHLYDGITSSEKSWGMCCSEEMAREYAEEWYDTGGWKEYWLDRFSERFFEILDVIGSIILHSIVSIFLWAIIIQFFDFIRMSQVLYDIVRYSIIIFSIIYIVRFLHHYRIWNTRGDYPWHKLDTEKFFSKLFVGLIFIVICTPNLLYLDYSTGDSEPVKKCELRQENVEVNSQLEDNIQLPIE